MNDTGFDVTRFPAGSLTVSDSDNTTLVGATVFTVLQDTIMRQTEYWRALLGAIILLLVLVFPGVIVGAIAKWFGKVLK